MRRSTTFLLCLIPLFPGGALAALPPSVSASSAGVTLADCFQRAKQISEAVGISAENVKFVQEQVRSEVGSILPHVDWIKSQFYQDRGSGGSGQGGATGSSLLTTQPLSYFQ